ncbi:DUF5665 domain-containing protein [Anaerovibrio sp.]|uniref:DUF5665 domain-containing protein n=1 Tax=Anaerovibrio sp. TaxID=1872532 RepID=UPI003F15CD7C
MGSFLGKNVSGSTNELEGTVASARQIHRDVEGLHEIMGEYLELLKNTRRLFLLNLLVGMVRGLGMAIGATIVFGIMLNVAVQVVDLNLPFISEWLAKFMLMVEENRHNVQ